MASNMQSIAHIRAWQQAQWAKLPETLPRMGAWLSKSWSSRSNEQHEKQKRQQAAAFNRVLAQGYFNLNLAPTRDEFDSDDDWSSTLYLYEDDEADGRSAWGRGVGSDIHDESRCALENRRPGFHDNSFG